MSRTAVISPDSGALRASARLLFPGRELVARGRVATWGLLAGATVFLASLSPAHDLTPEVAARLAGSSRALAHEAMAAWSTLDCLLTPLLGARGRLWLGHAGGGVQWLLGNSGREAAAPWAVMERSARELGRTDVALAALREQIEMQLGGGDYTEVAALSQSMLDMSVQSGSGSFQAAAEGYLGVLARRRGQLDVARQHQESALALRRALHDDAGTAAVLANLGTVYRDQGDFARALELQMEALELRRNGIADARIDLSYRNIALLYREIEDAKQARNNFSQALAAAESRHDPAALATVLGSFASFSNDSGEPNAALRMAQQALAIDTSLGNRPYVGLEHVETGRALLALDRDDEAALELKSALAIGRELGQREILGTALLQMGQLELRAQRVAEARRDLDESMSLLDSAQLKPQLSEALAVRQQLAERDGDTALALALSKRRAVLREELLGTKAGRQLAALRSRYERADSEQRIRLLNLDAEMQSLRLRQQTLLRNLGFAAVVALALLALVLAQRYRTTRRLNRELAHKNAEISAHEAALEETNAKLSSQTEELYHAAVTDPLTGSFNRGHLLRQLDAHLRDAVRMQYPLAILLIDFDHFKQVNDQHGHLFGDRVLASGVAVMREWLPPQHLFGRYGGEEFIVILDEHDEESAAALGERLRERVAQSLALAIGATRVLTVSIGVAGTRQLENASVEALLNAADTALYRAKAEGRNRVVRYAA